MERKLHLGIEQTPVVRTMMCNLSLEGFPAMKSVDMIEQPVLGLGEQM